MARLRALRARLDSFALSLGGQDRGYDCMRCTWKGGHRHDIALPPQTAQRIRD